MVSQERFEQAVEFVGGAPRDLEDALSERAHDLNNLLQIIGSSLHFMSRELDRPDQLKTWLLTAMDSLSRSAALARQLYPSAPGAVEEVVVVQSVIEGLQPLFAAVAGPRVAVQLALEPRPLSALVDRTGLERALLNLVVNARQALPGRGRIRISCREQMGEVVIVVDDNGPGFSPEATANAFRRRFTTKAAGSGLGLASVQAFAATAGGEARLGRADLGGARVSLALPLSVLGLVVPAPAAEH